MNETIRRSRGRVAARCGRSLLLPPPASLSAMPYPRRPLPPLVLLLLWLWLLACASGGPRGASAQTLNLCNVSSQRAALLDLYAFADGPNWVNNTGWAAAAEGRPDVTCTGRPAEADFCCWFGVSCCTDGVTDIDCDADLDCSCINNTVVSLRMPFNNVSRKAQVAWLTCMTLTRFACFGRRGSALDSG
eukprot:353226-Chlamydomonas_euryale.AAC.6